MRGRHARYSATHGFTPDGVSTLTEHVAGIDLGAFWRTAIEGTEELDQRGPEVLRSAVQAGQWISQRQTEGMDQRRRRSTRAA
jgi:hypothetical protein